LKIFRQSDDEQLAVKMAGVKLGDRLLVVGCGDPVLIAKLAVKTGLTGHAAAVDEDEARTARATAAIAREGALVETVTAPLTSLPLESDAFDVVVVHEILRQLTAFRRAATLAEARRVLRAGGRCLVIESAQRGGFGALISRRTQDPSYVPEGGAAGALQYQDFRAVRTLAEREGLVFVEGVKGNTRQVGDGG
jgi:ubiquinone/menaquinone biosynthesis C-methylase UbiE